VREAAARESEREGLLVLMALNRSVKVLLLWLLVLLLLVLLLVWCCKIQMWVAQRMGVGSGHPIVAAAVGFDHYPVTVAMSIAVVGRVRAGRVLVRGVLDVLVL
jgi:hypothetical protein